MLEFIPLGFASLGLSGLGAGLWLMRDAGNREAYVPRHRAPGRLSYLQEWQLHRALQADERKRATFAALVADRPAPAFPELADASHDAPEFDEPAQVKGSYAHLRTDELDSTAERFWRLVEKGIRPPSPWGTPEVDDVWDPIPEGVDGYAIAGRTR